MVMMTKNSDKRVCGRDSRSNTQDGNGFADHNHDENCLNTD